MQGPEVAEKFPFNTPIKIKVISDGETIKVFNYAELKEPIIYNLIGMGWCERWRKPNGGKH